MQTSTLRKPLELLALLLAFTLIAASCGDDDDRSEPAPTTTAADAPDESEDDVGEDSGGLGEDDPGDHQTNSVTRAFDSDGDGTVTIGVAAAGPRDDNGYYQSLVNFAEQFSADYGFAPPIVSDNIGAAEAAQALSDLAQQGVDIMMVGASEIAEPLPDLTEQYPEIFWYCNCGAGFQELPGLAQATDWGSPIHYTAGVAMAAILQDHGGDKAVFLGCCDINFEREAYNATVYGLQSVDPDFTMEYVGTGDFQFDFDNSANATAALTNAISNGVTLAYAYLGGALEAVGQLATDEGVAVFAAGPPDVCERDDGINWTGSIVFDAGVYARQILPRIIASDLAEGTTYQFPTEPGLNGALLCDAPADAQALLDEAFAKIAAFYQFPTEPGLNGALLCDAPADAQALLDEASGKIAAFDGELLGALCGISGEAYSGG